MDRSMGERMYGWMGRWMDRWMNAWMDEQVDDKVDEWVGGKWMAVMMEARLPITCCCHIHNS
jgi:hypothetical protein